MRSTRRTRTVLGGLAAVTSIALLSTAPVVEAHAPAAKPAVLLISGEGVGPYTIGTTGKKALKSKDYTDAGTGTACDGSTYVIPPNAKGPAAKVISVGWDNNLDQDWTPKAKVKWLYVYAGTIGKKRVQTADGARVGWTLAKLLASVKHLTKSPDPSVWAPVVYQRDGAYWINYFIDNRTADYEIIDGGWAALGKQKIEMIEISPTKIKYKYGTGTGGC